MPIIHKFQEAGLGVAPFRFVRIETRKYQACYGAPIQPGGCCAYCGEGIMECCVIRDANGKEFIVGNVCVGKTGDRGLVDTVKREVNRKRTEMRHQQEFSKIQGAREILKDPSIQEILCAQPHPNAWRAEKGDTRLEWANWMLEFAGNSGRMQVVKYIANLTVGVDA